MPYSNLPELITVKEAAAFLRVEVGTVQAYIRQKKLAASRLGRAYLIEREELKRFVESLKDPNQIPKGRDD